MNKNDLDKILGNMDDAQIEIISGFVFRIAAASAEKWTGQIVFSVNMNQGGLGDMGVSRNEVVRLQKKRGIRSGGVA